jgi:hypothetical protein
VVVVVVVVVVVDGDGDGLAGSVAPLAVVFDDLEPI